jgi:hypothetical protein
MFRKDLVTFLQDHPLTVAELARLFGASHKEVEDDLRHLAKSLKQTAYHLDVHPATCRKCAFVFSAQKLTKPSKCPRCRSTWIEEPLVQVSTS